MHGALPNPTKIAMRAPRRGWVSRFFAYDALASPLARRMRWGRVGCAAIGLGALAFASVCGTAFGYFRYRGLPDIRFIDVALPTRWPHIRAAQGQKLIAEAFQHERAERWPQAWICVRRGLDKFPAHRGGRFLLAELHRRFNQPEAAQQVLLDGLRFNRHDPRYLSTTIRLLLQAQEDARVVSLAEATLGDARADADCRRIAALAGATASFHRGNFDRADDFLAAVPRLAESPEGRLLAAKCDWDRGYRELAIVRLRALADARPADLDVHRELVTRLRQLGEADEARRRSLALQLARPELPESRAALLRAYHDSGDTARVVREIDALLRDHPNDTLALLAVADFAANTGQPALTRRLLEHARQRQLPWEPHALLHIEALIVAQDYAAAIAHIRELTQREPAFSPRHAAVLESLQALVHHALGEAENAQLYLTAFLGRHGHRAENLHALANRFVALDGIEHARRILLRAVETDPLNQPALTRLVELNLTTNRIDELPAQLARLVTLRKPSPDVLRVAHHKLGSDLFLFSAERDRALEAVRQALDAAEKRTRR